MKKELLPVALENIKINNLGMLSELHIVYYNDKNFFYNLRNKMYKVYLKRILLWVIVLLIVPIFII